MLQGPGPNPKTSFSKFGLPARLEIEFWDYYQPSPQRLRAGAVGSRRRLFQVLKPAQTLGNRHDKLPFSTRRGSPGEEVS